MPLTGETVVGFRERERSMCIPLRRLIAAACAAGVVGWAGPLSAAQYTFTNVTDTRGPLSAFTFPALNSAGTVAFYGTPDFGSHGIFAGNGGPLVTIADGSGGLNLFSTPDINASGVVVFLAQ